MAVLYYLGKKLRALTQNLFQMTALAAAIFVSLRESSTALLFSVGAVFAITGAAGLEYWFFRYRLEKDGVVVRRGVLKRTKLNLPFDRIQGVNVERSPIDRLLRLVTVRLDTAGTHEVECELACVTSDVADWVESRFRASKRERRAGSTSDGLHETPEPVASMPAHDVQNPVIRLGGADLARIGVAGHNTLLFVALFWILSQAGEAIFEPITRALTSAGDTLASLSESLRTLVVGLIILGGLAVAAAVAVAAAWVKYHDFTLWQAGERFHTRAGLLTQRSVSVERSKIQQLSFLQNPILRWLGRSRVTALSAASGQVQLRRGKIDPLEIPLATRGQAEEIKDRVFGAKGRQLPMTPIDLRYSRVSGHYVLVSAFRIVAGLAVLLGLVGVVVSFFIPLWYPGISLWYPGIFQQTNEATTWCLLELDQTLLVILAAVPVALLWSWLRWRNLGYVASGEGLSVRRGVLGRKVEAFLFRKAQAVTIRQSPYERRKGLATLHVALASDDIIVPCLPKPSASELRDYILYRVESSRLRWH